MKLAYVTTYDSSDIEAWSGSSYHIFQALRNSGLEAEPVKNLRDEYRYLTRAKKLFYAAALSRTYLRDRHPPTLRAYARQVASALVPLRCDVVFSPGTISIGYLEAEQPVVFWADATFAGMVDFYPAYSNLCRETVRHGHRLEQQALSRCRLAIYSSQWAADSAVRHYDVDPNKVKVVPFGANIECHRTANDIRMLTARKDFSICRLLFVGVDWVRKGGDLALQVAEYLNGQGLPTELHVVGCRPPEPVPDFVKCYGTVSKRTPAGRALLDRLFSEAHFLIVPSRAECYGIVYAEASSFGLPSLASNSGGIPSVVRNDRNGQTFPLDAGPERYGEYILAFMAHRDQYERLARSSFQEYAQTLNWSSAGRKVRELIHAHCA